jgi:hypothetical protein
MLSPSKRGKSKPPSRRLSQRGRPERRNADFKKLGVLVPKKASKVKKTVPAVDGLIRSSSISAPPVPSRPPPLGIERTKYFVGPGVGSSTTTSLRSFVTATESDVSLLLPPSATHSQDVSSAASQDSINRLISSLELHAKSDVSTQSSAPTPTDWAMNEENKLSQPTTSSAYARLGSPPQFNLRVAPPPLESPPKRLGLLFQKYAKLFDRTGTWQKVFFMVKFTLKCYDQTNYFANYFI